MQERNIAVKFVHAAISLFRRPGGPGERAQPAMRAGFDTRKWTPELLKHLEWRRFEELCAAYFEALGFSARVIRSAAGGGADLALCAAGSNKVSIIAHCKPWDAYRVGIKPVRDLHGAMTAAGVAEGVLVTSGRFTQEAVAFAAKQSIELVDGASLLANLSGLVPEKAAALLRLATQGDFLTPTCPSCAIKMAPRRSTQGGRKFWGCINYPRCKQTLFANT
jgi:restriction system protein